ncbi:MAG: rod shape-determining protein MreC [Eubacteriales bacterium]
MKDFFSKSGGLLLIVAFLLSVLVGASSIILQGSTDPIANAMGQVTAPFRNGVSTVAVWGEGIYDFVVRYNEMEEELAELKNFVAELEEIVREGEEALRENAQLRELLSLQGKRRDFVFESAKVSGRSFTGWESVLTLDKGKNAGVELGDCVITEAGHLVGVVQELGDNWCFVATVVSTDLSVGGIVSRTGTAGILEGEFSFMAQGQLKLSYLTGDSQIVPGDQVLTSGIGDIYPKGLTVGKILGVFDEPSGMSRYAVLVPDVELDSLIEVFIIKDFEIVE